ncbi:MAG TPA: bifunctional diaminohydroxyphosphoribosylaminopyrimidine deaminase/5-amino-6-(5-phosphoribosylamino)uracil reductase RibD [Burkholderiaceae bacterium]|nr:bifunctional diaminohydroxyphosphoribosylaminopyrimidine deaminase/5-amino-6-(5-phosphoribosylamino)uracil reductase RibD [Burkholderiaceae bacterium]
MFTPADHDFMARALELAELGLYSTAPNPRVGCVVVRDHQIRGEGWHRRAGEPHAEIIALAQAGGQARGATVYVTLEPCSHFGRTPPCVDTLIEARVARVVAAMEDPNPRVNGRGLERLRAAGIDVRCGLLQQEATELNIGFVSRMARGLPWVRLKTAASLDGNTALPDGTSQWITSEAARADGHAWRARACALLTGIGTVRDDDPQLNVRLVDTPRQPLKVLVDSRLQVPASARVLSGGQVLIVCAAPEGGGAGERLREAGAADERMRERMRELRERGCEVLSLANPAGKVDLPALMRELAQRGINELHVEAGSKLNGSLIRERCVDELLVYLAPSLLGDARRMFDLTPPATLEGRHRLRFVDTAMIGEDLRVRARFTSPGGNGH